MLSSFWCLLTLLWREKIKQRYQKGYNQVLFTKTSFSEQKTGSKNPWPEVTHTNTFHSAQVWMQTSWAASNEGYHYTTPLPHTGHFWFWFMAHLFMAPVFHQLNKTRLMWIRFSKAILNGHLHCYKPRQRKNCIQEFSLISHFSIKLLHFSPFSPLISVKFKFTKN